MKKNNIIFSKALYIIHDLDRDYTRLSDVPDDDVRLTEVIKLLGGKAKSCDDKTRERIIYFISKGFPIDEIADLTLVNTEKIKNIAKNRSYPIIDRFKWVTDSGIYAHHRSDFNKAFLAAEEIKTHRTFDLWSKLPMHTTYSVNGVLYLKTKLDIRNYKKVIF